MDREKVIEGIKECDLNGGLIGNCPYKDILALLKEQDEKNKELQNAYNYLQRQFFEVQDKLLKEQDAVVRCVSCTFYRSDGECALHNGRWKPEGFCSWAIRKEGR